MKNYRQLLKELPSNKVVFAFGRFQPPTALHELQVKVVKKLAEQQRADYVIYASKDLKEELLPVDKKVHYMNLMFPNTNIETTDASTFVEAVKKLNKKYKNIVMVASADCKEDYEKILNKKNGSEFFFETIEVVAAGDKDPDENKLRESAKKGDYTKFKVALPSALREIDSRRLMNDMRQSLGLDMVKEEIKLVKDELREHYFRGEIFKVGEVVESAGQQYEIVKRGSNHLLLKEESGKLVSKWIQDVTAIKEAAESPVVNTNSKYNIAKDVMRYKDFKKLNAMANGQVKEQEEEKATEQVPYDEPSEMEEFLKTITGTQHTGHTLNATDDNHRRRKIAYHLGEEFSDDEVQMIGELSTELLGRYKTASASDAKKSDSEGNYAKGDKRFKGINKATTKQFDNDLKKHGQYQKEEVELSEAAPFKTKEDAVKYAKEKVKTHRDNLDGIEIHAHSGGFDVNHTSNSSGRNSLQKIGAKHLGTIYKEEVELEEAHKVGDKVIIHKGPADVLGKVGHVGEIRKRWAGDTKTYTIDHDKGSIQLKPSHFKAFKEEVELEEGTFKYHMDKAIAAHERGDEKKKEYHLVNARSAKFAMKTSDYSKHKELFDKYKQMNESSDTYEQSEDHKAKAEMAKGEGNMGAYHAHMVNHHELKGHWHASKGRHEAADREYEKAEHHHNESLKHPFYEEADLDEAKKKKKTGDDFKPTAVEVKMKDDSQQLGANNAHGFDAFFNEEEEKEFSEQELDKMIDSMSDDDIMDAYEDHELAVVDDETGEEIEQEEDEGNPDLKVKITEVLSRTERIRARVRFARSKSKRQRGVKLALRRTSSSQTINKRARRLAIKLFKKRMLRGRPMSSVGVAEKERIERTIEKRRDVLNRVAMKLTSRVRQIEKARLHHHKFTNGGNGMNQV